MTSEPPPPSGYLALLRQNPEVRRMWIAQLVSQIGDWFNLVALFALARRYSPAAGAAGTLLVLQAVPALVLSPLTGTIADRFDRKRVLIVLDLVRTFTAVSYLMLDRVDLPGGRLLWLYLLAGLHHGVSAFWNPARGALIPTLARPCELPMVNALMVLTFSLTMTVGGALGGLAAGLVSPEAAFVFNAATFLVSALVLLPIRSTGGSAGPGRPGSSETLAGVVRELLRHKALLAAVLVGPTVAFVAGGLWLLSTLYGQRLFVLGRAGAISVGILLCAQGIGSLASTVAIPWLQRRTSPGSMGVMTTAIAVRALGLVMLALAPSLAFAGLALSCVTACGGLLVVGATTHVQQLSSDGMLGRITALGSAATTIAFALSARFAGWLIDGRAFSPRHVALVLAAVGGALALAWALAVAPRWKRWTRQDAATGAPV